MASVFCLTLRAEEFRIFMSIDGKPLEASIVKVTGEEVTLLRKSDKREFQISLTRFAEGDQKWIKQWVDDQKSAQKDTPPAKVEDALYPRTKDEIKEKLKEIKSRPRPQNMPKKLGKDLDGALEQLNSFRYLSGAPADVELDESLCALAESAAEACKKHGGLSHDLGSGTEVCNLHQGQGTRADMIGGYIDDYGANNREKRGHRRWCLNWSLKRTGFGLSEGFAAMHCLDKSGPKPTHSWSYPGRGYFPKDWLKGDAWSFYSPNKLTGQVTVKMWKFSRRPTQLPAIGEEPDGREVKVTYVSTYENAVNFEPEAGNNNGIYLVRIAGEGLAEQYLVELY